MKENDILGSQLHSTLQDKKSAPDNGENKMVKEVMPSRSDEAAFPAQAMQRANKSKIIDSSRGINELMSNETQIEKILGIAKNDPRRDNLLSELQEYAQVYLQAKQRQKGCDEMGEVATLRDELAYVLGKLVHYYREKKYLSENITFDIDTIAHGIIKHKGK